MLLILLILGIGPAFYVWGLLIRNKDMRDAGVRLFIVCSFGVVVALPASYLITMNTYAEVTAFVGSEVYTEYPRVVQAQIDGGVIGDISNAATGTRIIANLEEWLKHITETNRLIRKHQVLNQSYWFDWFVYDWPAYPDLIDAKKLRAIAFTLTKQVENIQAAPLMMVPVADGN